MADVMNEWIDHTWKGKIMDEFYVFVIEIRRNKNTPERDLCLQDLSFLS